MGHGTWPPESTSVDRRDADIFTIQDPAADISGGVEQGVQSPSSFTLFVSASAAVEVKVELSPDGGTTYFTPTESPISIGTGGGDAVEHFDYDVSHVKLTGNNTTAVQALIRAVS